MAVDPYAGSVLSSRPLPLEIVRSEKWSGFVGRVLHWWRYGFKHPDEDLIGVIEAVGDHLAVQIATAKAVLSGAKWQAVDQLDQDLRRELTSALPDFSNLLAIEAKLQALYPPALGRRRRWLLQERFQRVAATTARQAWAQDPATAGPELDTVTLEHALEVLRQARLEEDQAQAALSTATEAVAAREAKLIAAVDAVRALEPGFDPATTEDRLKNFDTSTEDGKAIAQRLEQVVAAQRAVEEARRSEAAASAAHTAAHDAAAQAKSKCKAAEAEQAVRRAQADLARKSALVNARRAEAEKLPQGKPERAEADKAVAAAESDRQNAQRVVDEKVALAAKLGQDGSSGGSGGGGGGGSGGGAAGAEGDGPNGAQPLTEEAADQLTLLNYVQSHYILTISREKAIRDLKRWLIMRFWFFVLGLSALLAVILLISYFVNPDFTRDGHWQLLLGLVTVAAVGRAGATMSIARRLQAAVNANVQDADPIIELTALRTGKNDIALALLSSSIFALLLYAFFLTGIPRVMGFQDGIFPETMAAAKLEAQAAEAARVNANREGAAGTGSTGTAAGTGIGTGGTQTPAPPAGTQPPSPPTVRGGATPASTTPAGAAPAQRQPAGAAPAAGGTLAAQAPAPAANASPAVTAPAETPDRQAELAKAANASVAAGQAAVHALQQAVVAQKATVAAAEARLKEAREAPLPQAVIDVARLDLEHAQGRLNDLEARLDLKAGAAHAERRHCRPNEECMPFNQMAAALGLATLADFFKLLLWAFIAGFAERFVPDVLDRIVSRAQPQPVVLASRPAAAAPPTPGTETTVVSSTVRRT